MQHFDHDFVTNVVERLKALAESTHPSWGRLTPDGLICHLADTLRYSMGRGPTLIDRSTWFTRRILGPLVLHGLLPIPKNVKAAIPEEGQEWRSPPSDLETLHALLEEYLTLVQAGELIPPPHPAFGNIGIDGWARMHVLHFAHHLRQFGL